MGCGHSTGRRVGDPLYIVAEDSGARGPRHSPVPVFEVNTKVSDHYIMGPMIGKGSFGSVYIGTSKVWPHEEVAIKIMNRAKVKATSIEREERVLKRLGHHKNIVQFKGLYKTPQEVSFVLELMRGGELFERLISRGAYSEADARRAFRQVAEALHYLHKRGIVHRDLKPENLLLSDLSERATVKIADFGLSQLVSPEEKLTKVCGTWAYAAPEMSDSAKPGYDFKFDTWSYGVILYVVLSGAHPFDKFADSSVQEIKHKAQNAIYDFDMEEWDNVSDLAKDLIAKLIVKNPEKRLDSAGLLRHPWFLSTRISNEPIAPNIHRSLSTFQNMARSKVKAAIHVSFAVISLRSMLMPTGANTRRAGTQPTPRTLAEQNMYAIPAGGGGGNGQGNGPPPQRATVEPAQGQGEQGSSGSQTRHSYSGRSGKREKEEDKSGTRSSAGAQRPRAATSGMEAIPSYDFAAELEGVADGSSFLIYPRRSSMPSALSSGDTQSRASKASKASFHLRTRSIGGDKVTTLPLHHDTSDTVREMRATASTRSFRKMLESKKAAGMATLEGESARVPVATEWIKSPVQSPTQQKMWTSPSGHDLYAIPLVEGSEAKWSASDSNSMYAASLHGNNGTGPVGTGLGKQQDGSTSSSKQSKTSNGALALPGVVN